MVTAMQLKNVHNTSITEKNNQTLVYYYLGMSVTATPFPRISQYGNRTYMHSYSVAAKNVQKYPNH